MDSSLSVFKTQRGKPRPPLEFSVKRSLLVFLMALTALGLSAQGQGYSLVLKDAPVRVYFSPNGGATEAVVAAIEGSHRSIFVMAYSFSSAPIAAALRNATRRGISVQIILDQSQETERYSSVDFLVRAGVPTQIDSQHAIQHSKTMVIDSETVITGSFNFTKAAEERNAENLLVIRSKELAAIYLSNWKYHSLHSPDAEPR